MTRRRNTLPYSVQPLDLDLGERHGKMRIDVARFDEAVAALWAQTVRQGDQPWGIYELDVRGRRARTATGDEAPPVAMRGWTCPYSGVAPEYQVRAVPHQEWKPPGLS